MTKSRASTSRNIALAPLAKEAVCNVFPLSPGLRRTFQESCVSPSWFSFLIPLTYGSCLVCFVIVVLPML